MKNSTVKSRRPMSETLADNILQDGGYSFYYNFETELNNKSLSLSIVAKKVSNCIIILDFRNFIGLYAKKKTL